MNASPRSNLPEARSRMRNLQKLGAAGRAGPPSEDASAIALKHVREREQAAVVEGDYIREGYFRFPAVTERARWNYTRTVIDRCAPGPHEDGNYFALLAREAASVEMYLTGLGNPIVNDAVQRIIFGTTGHPSSHARSQLVKDVTIILMSAGMIYFMYQSAKSVVLSWKPVHSQRGSTFSSNLEDTRQILDRDPTAVNHMADLLLEWFFKGVARPSSSTQPPAIYIPPLALLSRCAERFVLGHEYAHALIDLMHLPVDDVLDVLGRPSGPVTEAWTKEFRADALATIMVMESAGDFDRFSPNMSLQGAVLAMKAHDLVEGALRRIGLPRNLTTHPPFQQRLDFITRVFSETTNLKDFPINSVIAPAQSLELIWERVSPKIERKLNSGKQLSPIWHSS